MRPEAVAEESDLLPLPGMELKFLGRPAHTLVAIPGEVRKRKINLVTNLLHARESWL
jgi:hypothetical protein